MRDFTEEEKEKIISTPITMECFDMDGFFPADTPYNFMYRDVKGFWTDFIEYLEQIRQDYIDGYDEKDEQYFQELVRLLPNSYKVVDLCNGVKKDSQGFPDRYCEVEITMQDGSVIYGKYDPAIGFMTSDGRMIWKEKVAEYKVVKL